MKKISKLLMLLVASCLSFATQAQDTIRIEVGTKTQILIYAEDRQALRDLSEVDLNEIIEQVTSQIDSTESVVTYEYKNKKSQLTLEEVREGYEELEEGYEEEYDYDYEGEYEYRYDPHSERYKGYFFTGERYSFRSYGKFRLDIGLNNFVEDGQLVEEGTNKVYELDFLSSRYIAVGMFGGVQMGGSRSPLHFRMGVELSWYNFMFDGNTYMREGADEVEFADYEQDFGESLTRNKLMAAYVNIPLTVTLEFRNRSGNSVAHLGFGGYVGYRVQSYFKTKTNDGEVNRDRNSFYLNNIRYGLEGELGFGGLNFFIKYDFNPVFQTERGPNLNAVSFGVRI